MAPEPLVVWVTMYVLVPAVTIEGLPVPLSAMPLTGSLPILRKLWLELAKTEFVKAPPVAGLIAMVQPPGRVDKHCAKFVVGGIVVLTMNEPDCMVGLKMTCSYTRCAAVLVAEVGKLGSLILAYPDVNASDQPYCAPAPEQPVVPAQQMVLLLTVL